MDRTSDGRPIRMLTIVDEYTRDCLAIDATKKLTSEDVLERLSDLFVRRGVPEHIRSDNGSEFTARSAREWLGRVGVKTLYIEPGLPSYRPCMANNSAGTKLGAASVRGQTDFVSYHWRADREGLVKFWGEIDRMHGDAGYRGLKYANTEMGAAMPTLSSERTQAVWEMQKLLHCWAHGHVGVLLYSSRELWWPRQYSYDSVSDYGFVDHFFCLRFAYGAAAAQVLDPMGNASPADSPTRLSLRVGEYPLSVLLHEANRLELSD